MTRRTEVNYVIYAPHYVASLAVNEEGAVVDAAPILHWTRGWPWSDVRKHFIRKGYRYESLD